MRLLCHPSVSRRVSDESRQRVPTSEPLGSVLCRVMEVPEAGRTRLLVGYRRWAHTCEETNYESYLVAGPSAGPAVQQWDVR